MRIFLVGMAICLGLAQPAAADLVLFDVRGTNGDFDFNTQTGTFTDSGTGLMITFSAQVDGIDAGVVNATGDSLGINAPGTDDTDQIDGDAGVEELIISFSGPSTITNVLLTELDIIGHGPTESATLTIGGSSAPISNGTGTAIPGHTNLLGSSFSLAFVSGNGFGLETFSLHITAVPEPSSLMFAGLFSILGCGCRRRRA